ncbi:hypothetical protein, partial [Micromonospora sp. 4G55]|uniref:hypothetical protein n=1 Tax=Micromonospora sp. 4G55 TaxID=2806102 RepID=UPI001EE3D5E8
MDGWTPHSLPSAYPPTRPRPTASRRAPTGATDAMAGDGPSKGPAGGGSAAEAGTEAALVEPT